MKTPLMLIIAILAMALLPSAANWTMDGNGGVYWTENGYKISAYPAYAQGAYHFTQYVNFTSTNPNPLNANLSFVFVKLTHCGGR